MRLLHDVRLLQAELERQSHQLSNALDEARRNRDFVERLLETAPCIVLVLDRTGRVLRFNRHFQELTGWGLDEARGADWFAEFLPDGERARIREVFDRTLHGTGTTGTSNAVRMRHGGEVQIEWHNAVLREPDGSVPGVLAIGLDVTQRKQLEESQRLEAVGELAAGVAHEINNPVNTIINCAQLVLDGDPARENCRIIIEEGERIAAIVKDLLQFARDDRGALTPTSLAEVVARTVRLVGENMKRHGIALCVDVPADLPHVQAHPQQLQQVLLNLLINAKDALQERPAGASRHIEVAARPGGDGLVRCSVRDDGPGIAPDLAAHVFEPFVTTKRAHGGTGLGLSVSRSIVESFGGSLGLRSVTGEFAEFTFTLREIAPGRAGYEPPSDAPRGAC